MKEQNNALTANEWRELESEIKENLIQRGFRHEYLLNNRGLIGATIEEMLLIDNAKLLEVLNQVKEEKTGMFEQTCGISRMDYILGFDEAIERIEELTLKTK